MRTGLQCPHCRQPINAADEVCEECGAVLTPPAAAGGRTGAAPAVARPVQAATAGGTCPNCQAPVAAGAEICEACGVVLATTGNVRVYSQTAPALRADECPQCRGPRTVAERFCRRCGANYTTSLGGLAPSAPVMPLNALPADTVLAGKYRVVKAIGAGGMGAVYLAEDCVLKRPVVIKALLQSDDPAAVAQAVQEREFLASIKHTNIVAIYDFITVGADGYIVMEYVQGKTLYEIMEDHGGPLPVSEAVSYILAILPAFTYLTKLGLVYCDFKPQNVMLEILKDGSRVVKLIDLGTVIHWTPKPEAIYGTEGYYAPEAIQAPSPRTDLYTICRALALMVTWLDLDNPPFGMPPAEYYKAFRDYPVLYRLLVKGTHTTAGRRFNTAEELGDQLAGVQRLIAGGTPGVPVSSRLFNSAGLTTTGKLGLRGEPVLDESDAALDLLRVGDQALRGGNLTAAVGYYHQALGANPKSLDAHLRLAEIAIEGGKFTEALAQVTQMQRTAPGHWKVAWYTGRLLEAQGDLSAVAESYSDLLADLPGELPPQVALARVRARQGDHSGAVALYTAVLKADPGSTETILGLTEALLALDRFDEAAEVLGRINEAAAKYIDAQLLLCHLFLVRMVPLTAANVSRAAQAIGYLEGRTEDPRYYLARGEVYRRARDLARAGRLPTTTTLVGVPDTAGDTLGSAAEAAYVQYLRRAANPPDREQIVRRRFAVAPWRLW